MKDGFRVFDADAHVIYPKDLWQRYLPERFRDRIGLRRPHPTYDGVTTRWDELESMAAEHPGRFAAALVADPTTGMAGVRDARVRLEEPYVVGLWIHTHSWDRTLDHADRYPWYALCSELFDSEDMHEYVRFDVFAGEPHYHYDHDAAVDQVATLAEEATR